jgi:phosphate/phosphite/phosphonate ABC transporter binding protein
MRLRKWLLLVFALSLIVAACGDDEGETTTTTAAETTTTTEASGLELIEPGILTIGSDVPYPPFEDFDAEGNVIGFDADLMNEIAARLGLEPRWLDTDFDTIFTQLAQGNFDVVASSVTLTAERAQMVNFTDGYYNTNQGFTVNTNETPNIHSTADLVSGDAVAVQTGTTGEIWAMENLEPLGIVVRTFQQPPDAFAALEGGQVVGTVIDVDPSLDAQANRPGLEVVEYIDTNELLAFGVNPEAPNLLAEINRVFREMVADGTYQEMYDAWITRPDASILYVPPEPVAIGTEENPIQVLYVPSVSAEDIIAGGELLAAELNAATGLFFEVSVPTSYAATVEEMCASPDKTMGFIPAQGYILANNLCGANVSLKAMRFGFDVYWTQFIVPRDSELQTLEDLAGKTWAFVDATSTSGYIVPAGLFASMGIEVGESFAASSHDAVVRAIYNDEADFGTTFYSPYIDADGVVIWDGDPAHADVPDEVVESCALDADGQIDCSGYYPRDARRNLREELPDVIQQVRIMTISDPIPNDTLTFGPDFPENLRTQIVDTLKAFAADDPEGFAAAFNAYSWNGLSDTNDTEFDSIRTILTALGYNLENLG